jgi:hypothetical protein
MKLHILLLFFALPAFAEEPKQLNSLWQAGVFGRFNGYVKGSNPQQACTAEVKQHLSGTLSLVFVVHRTGSWIPDVREFGYLEKNYPPSSSSEFTSVGEIRDAKNKIKVISYRQIPVAYSHVEEKAKGPTLTEWTFEIADYDSEPWMKSVSTEKMESGRRKGMIVCVLEPPKQKAQPLPPAQSPRATPLPAAN